MKAERIPGAMLLHAWPLAAASLIVVNVLWVRPAHPGLVSGKLSGAGICFLLPVVLAAVWEWLVFGAQRLGAHVRLPGAGLAAAASLAGGGYYAALELVPEAGRLHEAMIGAVSGSAVHVTRDPTDLACLVLTPIACLYLRRSIGASPAALTTRGRSP